MENWKIDFENAKIKFSKIDKQLNRHFTVMFYLLVLIISFIAACIVSSGSESHEIICNVLYPISYGLGIFEFTLGIICVIEMIIGLIPFIKAYFKKRKQKKNNIETL